ncbi:MAG: hypothetical protein ACI83P_000129 [Janthinobacterium sp.]|jgi:hypothetical protein
MICAIILRNIQPLAMILAELAPDKTEHQILAILRQHGRLSNQAVTQQMRLSPSPCLGRIKRLEDICCACMSRTWRIVRAS